MLEINCKKKVHRGKNVLFCQVTLYIRFPVNELAWKFLEELNYFGVSHPHNKEQVPKSLANSLINYFGYTNGSLSHIDLATFYQYNNNLFAFDTNGNFDHAAFRFEIP